MGFSVNVVVVVLLFVTVLSFSTRAAKLPEIAKTEGYLEDNVVVNHNIVFQSLSKQSGMGPDDATTVFSYRASAFGRCSVIDPEMDQCLRKNVEGAIHFLKAGAPELGFDTFDPLHIPQLIIGEGTGPVNVAQNFKDVDLYGLTDSSVHSVHIDFEKKTLLARSTTPMLRLQGKYTMKGRVLLLPIVGDGLFNVTLINTKINHTVTAESFEKKGNTYWRFKTYTVTLRPEKMEYKFDNLFDGDERLGHEINKVLNDNWSEVFTDVRGGYEESFGIIFHGLANRVFTRVPLKDIFLDMH